MDFERIRKLVVFAMFSDDILAERLVLKGANALELVHKVVTRGSLDIDLAMESEFEDLQDSERRIFTSLDEQFDSVGFVVFDKKFYKVPQVTDPDKFPHWGGYRAEFKIIERDRYKLMNADLERMRREAHTVSPSHHRTFKIDISKHEFCAEKEMADLDEHTIFVYTPEMCAIEKLRAICQQMPEYKAAGPKHRTPRARDFYDIYSILTRLGIDLSLPENRRLCRKIFAAKDVPVDLLSKIQHTREFHRQGWDQVMSVVSGDVMDFDYYFDFVVNEAALLHTFGVE